MAGLSYAQQGVQVGIIVQPSITTMRPAWLSESGDMFDPDYNQTLRTSFGLQLDYHFTPNLGVEADIIYSPQGQKFYMPDTAGTYRSHFYKFNFVKIPLLFSFSTSGSNAVLLGSIGTQIQIITHAVDEYSNSDHDITDSYAPLNLGFNFGVGIGFYLAKHAMLTVMPKFDVTFLNYNYSDYATEPAYLSKSPVSTCFGMALGIKFVKNENTAPSQQQIN